MTDLKFNLLDKLYSATPLNPVSKIDLLNSGFSSPQFIERAIKDLKVQGFVKSSLGSDIYEATPDGRTAYESEKEKRYNDACQKRQKRFNNKVAVATVLVPTITFFFGLVIEHRTQLVELVISLFK